MSAKASGSDANQANGSAKNRQHHDGSANRSYTPEQKAAVLRIKRCQPTAFYEILGLEEVRTTCSDGEIKKAYRKLSLLTHPDKNGYDGADEAFKLVSRAFQVLSDPDKKAKYDKFGGDPDNRFGGSGGGGGPSASSPFSNFARASAAGGRPGPMFEEEISPEEMFRQFFGGGMGGGFGPFGGGLFDTGPGFVFNVGGGPGIRVHQFGGPRPRRRPATASGNGQEPPPSLSSTFSSLLPLLILFVIPLLSSLFSGASQAKGPSLNFEPVPPHTKLRTSTSLKVPYYVDPSEVQGFSTKNWRQLDNTAEARYMQILHNMCDKERMTRQRLYDEAHGWFSTDEKKRKESLAMKTPSCDKLAEYGYSR